MVCNFKSLQLSNKGQLNICMFYETVIAVSVHESIEDDFLWEKSGG